MEIPNVSSTVDSFIETATADQILTGESIPKYRVAIGTFVRIIGDLPVTEITGDRFRELKTRMVAQGAGPSHINGVIHAMKRFLHYCRYNRKLPIPDLTDVVPMKVPRRAVTYLTAEEVDQFVSTIKVHNRNGTVHMHGLCFRTLIETVAGSGMRISEALSIDRLAIDWKDHQARIVGKGGKQRPVFFIERAMRWLRRYVEQRTDRHPALFISARSGKRLSRNEAQRLCRLAVLKSGIKKPITLHILRHTFATTLLKNGCPIGHIQGLLGHERLETTCRYLPGIDG